MCYVRGREGVVTHFMKRLKSSAGIPRRAILIQLLYVMWLTWLSCQLGRKILLLQ
jgi:hypothetical protein